MNWKSPLSILIGAELESRTPHPILKRRNILKRLAAASVVVAPAALFSNAQAADEKGDDKDKKQKLIDYLFVQHSGQATLADGVLTLKNAASETLYFSDRPDRIAGRITTAEFVEHWAKGDDNFKENPPNAVLSVFEEPEPKDVVVVLKNPRLEGENLIYDVEVTDGDKSLSGEASSLFIDVIGMPLTPLSYAGVARRTTRRVVRRR